MKKVLATILCLALVLSCLPMSALADVYPGWQTGGPAVNAAGNSSMSGADKLGAGIAVSVVAFDTQTIPYDAANTRWDPTLPNNDPDKTPMKNVIRQASSYVPKKTGAISAYNVVPSYFASKSFKGVLCNDMNAEVTAPAWCTDYMGTVNESEAMGYVRVFAQELLAGVNGDKTYQSYPSYDVNKVYSKYCDQYNSGNEWCARAVVRWWVSASSNLGWDPDTGLNNVQTLNDRYIKIRMTVAEEVVKYNDAAKAAGRHQVPNVGIFQLGTLDYIISIACRNGCGGYDMAKKTLNMVKQGVDMFQPGLEKEGGKRDTKEITYVLPALDVISFGKYTKDNMWYGMPTSVYLHSRGLTTGNKILMDTSAGYGNTTAHPIESYRGKPGGKGVKLGDASGWTARLWGVYNGAVAAKYSCYLGSTGYHLHAQAPWLTSVAQWCVEKEFGSATYWGFEGLGYYGFEYITPVTPIPTEEEHGSEPLGTKPSSGVVGVTLTTPDEVLPDGQATVSLDATVTFADSVALFRDANNSNSLGKRDAISTTIEHMLALSDAGPTQYDAWGPTKFTFYFKLAGDGKFPNAPDSQTDAQGIVESLKNYTYNATGDGTDAEKHLKDPKYLDQSTRNIYTSIAGTDFSNWGVPSANIDVINTTFASMLQSNFGSCATVATAAGGVTMTINPGRANYEEFLKAIKGKTYTTAPIHLAGQPATLEGENDYTAYVFYCGCSIQWFQFIRTEHWTTLNGVTTPGTPTFAAVDNYPGIAMASQPKIDGVTVSKTKPPEKIFYYSDTKPMYSEFKTGDIYKEPFDAMLGTPTYTETNFTARSGYNMYRPGEDDFAGTKYSSQGHYTQYYAVGGSEFVVQFDGSYHANETATRTYSATFSNTLCDNDKGPCQSPHTHGSDPPSPCSTCHQTHGCKHNTHQVGDTFTWTQTTKGLCYIAIDNVRVWQLKQTRLEGGDLQELFSEDPIMGGDASAKKIGVSWNIADKTPNAASGRVIYTYETAQGDKVNIPGYPKTSDRSCDSHTDKNATTLHGTTSSITCDAWCVSDYIILHTSNGDIPILYHEYKAQGAKKIDKTGSGTSFSAEEIVFDPKTQEELWNSNANATYQWDPLDLTYGGYNGKYNQTSTKYNSSGRTSSFDWSQTAIFKVSGAKKFFSRGGGSGGSNTRMNCMHTSAKGSKFNLKMGKWGLKIPDTTLNNDYDTGECSAFYELVTDCAGPWLQGQRPGSKSYSTVAQPDFSNKQGFVVTSIPYTESSGEFTEKINNIVVFNPVSNQDFEVVSLLPERDQRAVKDTKPAVPMTYGCPGDETCEFQSLSCTVTNHLHNESCYSTYSYKVHTGNNVHEHTDDCSFVYVSRNCSGKDCMSSGRHNPSLCPYGHSCSGCSRCHTCEDQGLFSGSGAGVCDCYHCGNPACSNYCSNHRYACSETCSVVHPTKEYTCGDKPLNKHVCDLTIGTDFGGGSNTKTFNYTGSEQSITLQPGTYTFEAFGAEGGNSDHGAGGGLGGYSKGTLKITSPTTIYINVGGKGERTSGGYNGGGPSYASSDSAYGGGATSIATSSGALRNLVSNKGAVLLVAGGGGAGGCTNYAGGAGGGANQNGTDGTGSGSYGNPGGGGKVNGVGWQGEGTYAAGFGFGGWSSSLYNSGGGGGGYYGGQAGNNVSGGGASGGGGSGYANTSWLTGISGTTGTNSGNGKVVITGELENVSAGCYDCSFQVMTCNDPHHTWDTCWKVYTFGMLHESGNTCTGSSCVDTTPIVNYKGVKVPLAKFKSGYLVQHTDGRVHIAEKGSLECLICGERHDGPLQVKQSEDGGNVTLNCTEGHRTLNKYELDNYTSHYQYGNRKCWEPCNNPANHNSTAVNLSGTGVRADKFINLDYPFTVNFPNTGNFAGTGKLGSANISMERGKGYSNNMDTTQWIARKWIEFPFDVSMRDSYGVSKSYKAYERIYLNVPDVKFTFYCVLENFEAAGARAVVGTEAINDDLFDAVENPQANNIKDLGSYERYEDCTNYDEVDVVGRIGAMTMEDVGDFRYSNFFKQTLETWLVDNVIRKVNPSLQNNLIMDPYDIRGVSIKTGVTQFFTGDRPANGDTYGIREERCRRPSWQFPLTCGLLSQAQANSGTKAQPWASNQQALAKQPVRIGYNAYMDFTTLGNYYGRTLPDDTGVVDSRNKIVVRPRYFRLDIKNNTIDPCDVYMVRNGSYVLINDNDADITKDGAASDTLVSLNWVEEHVRRNCFQVSDKLGDLSTEEDRATTSVATQFGLDRPRGTSFTYGTYDYLELWDRNRTCIGTKYTYVPTSENIQKSTDPQSRFPGIVYNLQGARWHFTVGLPSSAVFVPSGTNPNTVNSDTVRAYANGDYVIACGLEVYAYGDVWTLVYDGKNVNGSFQLPDSTGTNKNLTPNGWPQFTYQEKPDKKLILVEIVSINHSSKEDLNQSGTH